MSLAGNHSLRCVPEGTARCGAGFAKNFAGKPMRMRIAFLKNAAERRFHFADEVGAYMAVSPLLMKGNQRKQCERDQRDRGADVEDLARAGVHLQPFEE